MVLPQDKKRISQGYQKTNPQTSLWKLKNNKAYKEFFRESTLKDFPMLDKTSRLCRRWVSKGYFFKDCKNSAIHCDRKNEINSFYDYYKNKCGKISTNKN